VSLVSEAHDQGPQPVPRYLARLNGRDSYRDEQHVAVSVSDAMRHARHGGWRQAAKSLFQRMNLDFLTSVVQELPWIRRLLNPRTTALLLNGAAASCRIPNSPPVTFSTNPTEAEPGMS
jgi:hypothetical protein